jgi:uncharacterized repeat protein (TIGR01451 family)
MTHTILGSYIRYAVLLAALAVPGLLQADVRSVPTWFDTNAVGTAPDWHYRVPITIPAASVNSTIKLDVDFASVLGQLGVSGTFDAGSPRVVRSTGVLSTDQEFTDVVYAGATDAAGNGRGEVRFLLEDAGPVTYYLYFDIAQNGAKTAWPNANTINGNFEFNAGTGDANPPNWTSTKINGNFDAQIRPSENPSIGTDGTVSGNGAQPRVTDGTPNTGNFSYLLGARTGKEAASGNPAVTLTRTIAVPSSNPGTLTIRYRVEGWDSSANGAGTTQYDFLRISLVGGTTTEIVGPATGAYTTFPFSPNLGLVAATTTVSGYGQYNGWDTSTNGTHRSGMTLARGAEPWFTQTASLASYAGQTITLRVTSSHTTQYKTWLHVDNVEWSVVAGTLGTPQAFGANITAPNDTAVTSITVYAVGNVLVIRALVDAAPTAVTNPVTADVSNQNGTLVATGVKLFNDGTHGDAAANDNIWTNNGTVVADPTYTFLAADPRGPNWLVRVFAKDGSTSTIGAANGLVHIPSQPNTPSTKANFYNIDEQSFTLGGTVSGNVYRDLNGNGTLETGEDWTAGVAVFVNLVQGGSVVRSATVNPGTGTYSFTGVAPGAYTLVATNSAVNTAAVVPAGWLFVSPSAGSLNVSVGNGDVSNQHVGLLNGSLITGRVFNDSGVGGGTANDGIQNGSEAALAGVTVKLTDTTGVTVYSTAMTDGSGNYTLIIPSTLTTGTTLKVVETNLGGYVSTGGQIGTTGGAYVRAVDTTTFTLTAGTTYSGVTFAEVPDNSLVNDGQQSGLPGTEVFYAHTFTADTGGTVTLSLANAPTPAIAGWSQTLYRDTNCNGSLDAGEPALAGSVTLAVGGQLCFVIKETIPGGAPMNAVDKITVTATFTYTNATPALSSTYVRTDLTTVGTPTAGALKLAKTVNSSSALPGSTLVYTITYTNTSSDPLNTLVVNDATPPYTTFLSAACGSLGTGLTGCAVSAQPIAGATGAIKWTLTGTLSPTGSGSVTYSVQVQP